MKSLCFYCLAFFDTAPWWSLEAPMRQRLSPSRLTFIMAKRPMAINQSPRDSLRMKLINAPARWIVQIAHLREYVGSVFYLDCHQKPLRRRAHRQEIASPKKVPTLAWIWPYVMKRHSLLTRQTYRKPNLSSDLWYPGKCWVEKAADALHQNHKLTQKALVGSPSILTFTLVNASQSVLSFYRNIPLR